MADIKPRCDIISSTYRTVAHRATPYNPGKKCLGGGSMKRHVLKRAMLRGLVALALVVPAIGLTGLSAFAATDSTQNNVTGGGVLNESTLADESGDSDSSGNLDDEGTSGGDATVTPDNEGDPQPPAGDDPYGLDGGAFILASDSAVMQGEKVLSGLARPSQEGLATVGVSIDEDNHKILLSEVAGTLQPSALTVWHFKAVRGSGNVIESKDLGYDIGTCQAYNVWFEDGAGKKYYLSMPDAEPYSAALTEATPDESSLPVVYIKHDQSSGAIQILTGVTNWGFSSANGYISPYWGNYANFQKFAFDDVKTEPDPLNNKEFILAATTSSGSYAMRTKIDDTYRGAEGFIVDALQGYYVNLLDTNEGRTAEVAVSTQVTPSQLIRWKFTVVVDESTHAIKRSVGNNGMLFPTYLISAEVTTEAGTETRYLAKQDVVNSYGVEEPRGLTWKTYATVEDAKADQKCEWAVQYEPDSSSGSIVLWTGLGNWDVTLSADGKFYPCWTTDLPVTKFLLCVDAVEDDDLIKDAVLQEHIVQGIQPEGMTVNLFDYTVDPERDGADGENDLLTRSDSHIADDGRLTPMATVADWNKGINEGRLLLFGDAMSAHSGLWNKGSGSGKLYGQKNAGMSGIVKSTLGANGYPTIDVDEAGKNTIDENNKTIENEADKLTLTSITNARQSGDHNEDNPDGDSTDIKNISNTVMGKWNGDDSLRYLFDPETESDVKKAYQNVTNLFQLDDQGYYYYDARKNFAEFNPTGSNALEDEPASQVDQHSDGNFVLYDAPAVARTDSNDPSVLSIGNFFPFNKGNEVFIQEDQDGNLISAIGNSYSSATGAKSTSSDITTPHNPNMNHHMGMTIETSFMQPTNGMINMGAAGSQPMTFQFSGDDDVWVFIDDVLVLDLGGIHSEIYGSIDFADGMVYIGQSWKTNGFPLKDGVIDEDALKKDATETYKLKDLFKAAQGDDFNESEWSGDTFASNTDHTFKMFYLERGNYDSSLALRFNLQPLLYQQMKKVDQNGDPVEGVEFALYAAKHVDGGSTQDATDAVLPEDADSTVTPDLDSNRNNYVYYDPTRKKTYKTDEELTAAKVEPLATLTTDEDGIARFEEYRRDAGGNIIYTTDASGQRVPAMRPFNFADRETDDDIEFYILKETKAPDGYRTLPVDVVLQFERETSMLVVANRWITGAYSSFTSTIQGNSSLTYGRFDEENGEILDSKIPVDNRIQQAGLVVAVPMLWNASYEWPDGGTTGQWRALYGSSTTGLHTSIPSARTPEAWRKAVLAAALYQCSDATPNTPQWYLSYNRERQALEGTLSDLPGRADRYEITSADDTTRTKDMKMVYMAIDPNVMIHIFEDLGWFPSDVTSGDAKFNYVAGTSDDKLYEALTTYVNKQLEAGKAADEDTKTTIERVVNTIYDIDPIDANAPSEAGVSFLNTDQFIRNFRSLIYVPNEQRELRVWKVNQDGKGVNGVTFELIRKDGEQANTVAATGVTATVDGQDGVLVFTPSPQRNKDDSVVDGYAYIGWTRDVCTNYILKEVAAPKGVELNPTDIPVVVGDYSIYADAGDANDGVTVMAGVGKLCQTMVKYAADEEVNITLRDITAVAQAQESGAFESGAWKDVALEGTGGSALRTMNLHYGKNAVVDYGLHDADGGQHYYPFFVTDTGYLRARVQQNAAALGTGDDNPYAGENTADSSASWDNLGDTDITSLFSLLNVVVVTDQVPDLPETGELAISKMVEGDKLEAADYERNFEFTLSLEDADGNPVEGKFDFYGTDKSGQVGNGDTIPLHHDEQIVIQGLPEGTVWSVKEKDSEGWNVIPESGVIDGTIDGGHTSVAGFVNTNKKPDPAPASFIIHKTVAGDDGEKDRDFNFKVEMWDEDGNPLTGSYPYVGSHMGVVKHGETIALRHGERVAVTTLPAGTKYKVTELEADQDGYTTDAEGDEGELASNDSPEASFVNSRSTAVPEVASLKISKTVEGDEGDRTQAFTFKVELLDAEGVQLEPEFPYEDSNGKAGRLRSGDTVKLKHGEWIQINNLTPGTQYRVSELEANDGGYSTEVKNGKGTLKADKTVEVSFVNTKPAKPPTGSFIISKKVEGAGDVDREFTFEVRLFDEHGTELTDAFPYEDSSGKEGTLRSGDTVKLKHGESIEISGLPVGSSYEVGEREANKDGYVTISSGAAGDIEADGDTPVAAFTNYLAPDPATVSFAISKTVTGETGERDRDFHFKVELRDADGNPLTDSYSYVGSRTGEVKHGDTIALRDGEHVIVTGLPVGTRYKVTEVEAGQDGYQTEVSGDKGELPEGGTAEAAFINTRPAEPKLANLRVSKTVAGEGAETERAFTFQIKLFDAAGAELEEAFSYTGSAEGTLRSGDTVKLKGGEWIVVADLPAGARYQVTELEADQDGYTTEDEGAEGELEADTTAEASFVNFRPADPATGSFAISKTVEGTGGDTSRAFTFRVRMFAEDGSELTGEFAYTGASEGTIASGGTVRLSHGQRIVVEGLPVGSTYEVAELEANEDGYETTSTGAAGEVAAVAAEKEIPEAAFINKRDVTTPPSEDPPNEDPPGEDPPNEDPPSEEPPSEEPPGEEPPQAPGDEEPKGDIPRTGDAAAIAGPVAIAALLLLGAGILRRRRMSRR